MKQLFTNRFLAAIEIRCLSSYVAHNVLRDFSVEDKFLPRAFVIMFIDYPYDVC